MSLLIDTMSISAQFLKHIIAVDAVAEKKKYVAIDIFQEAKGGWGRDVYADTIHG